MTRYYFDTEFDDNQETGRINLISIGIVCDDGRELYLINKDCDHRECNAWVRANVLPQLPPMLVPPAHVPGPYDPSTRWRSHVQIRDAVQAFILDDGNPVEIWAYFASYDWVIFCQLWGEMINLPKHFPKFVRDLKTYALDVGFTGKFKELLPDTGHHDALCDARWNHDVHEILRKTREGALLRYVQHESDCDWLQPMWHKGPCDCGLKELIEQLPESLRQVLVEASEHARATVEDVERQKAP